MVLNRQRWLYGCKNLKFDSKPSSINPIPSKNHSDFTNQTGINLKKPPRTKEITNPIQPIGESDIAVTSAV